MTAVETTLIPIAGDAPYTVHVGRGARAQLADVIDERTAKVLIVHQPSLAQAAESLREQLSGRAEVLLAEVPDAEAAKRVEVLAFCWQVLGQSAFTRTDTIIGLGGGAATDLAGFVAATWLRGIHLIQLPTSLLAMVDAAVGGKTGINTAEGKNLVGAFYTPDAVIVDLEYLDTLPHNELIGGFGEIAKCGFIGAPGILDTIRADVAAATDPTTAQFRSVVESAIRLKADVVSHDFREAGGREFLNYGHTLGHAIEYAERYRWRHGAAVAVGMVYAAELSRLAGRLDDAGVQLHRDVLTSLGLPTSYRAGLWPTLLEAMHRDKKSRGSMLRFVVLDRIGHPSILAAPEDHLLFTAYQDIAE